MVTTNPKRRLRLTTVGGEEVSGSSSERRSENGDLSKRKGAKSKMQSVGGLGLLVALLIVLFSGPSAGKRNELGSQSSDVSKPRGKRSENERQSYRSGKQKHVTAYLEPSISLQGGRQPLPRRSTSRSLLTKQEFPQVKACSKLTQEFGTQIVNSFANFTNKIDPFLPWIHDFFLSQDHTKVMFVGQNRRNCDTGKDRKQIMEFWAPQISLFQPVPVLRTDYQNGTSRFRLFGELDPQQPQFSKEEKHDPTVINQQVIPETRFLCRFHWRDEDDRDHDKYDATSSITLSEFDFNYEYVSWRKKVAMFAEGDTTRSDFWNSQLMFSCPTPPVFQTALNKKGSTLEQANVLVDIIPIRTPPRSDKVLFTPQMVGPEAFAQLKTSDLFYNAQIEFGTEHLLPEIADSGRWANLPVCPRESIPHPKGVSAPEEQPSDKKPHRMVLCTWTSASYHRRGEDEDQPLSDNSLRLREWLIFHKLVGFDHVYIYDNTPIEDYSTSTLYQVIQEFDPSFVTHHPWPATICNNHRPGNKNPGDRSSQYSAEASCRERFGPSTDWMAFIDTDEYLTPMKMDADEPSTWKPVLDEMERRGVAIMKFKSGRNYPRIHLMDPLENQNTCGDPVTERFLKDYETSPCLVPRRSETFLKIYNCDSIKRPRPERFQRAMKQIYRPDYVFSHFVHYSTVTEFNARYYDPNNPIPSQLRNAKFDPDKEVFVDEIHEGTLIHARSVVPRETMFRSTVCQVNYKKMNCFLGYECPDSVDWIDDMDHRKGARRTKTNMNPHHDENGKFCSCWVNDHVEQYWIPRLETGLAQHMADLNS